MQYYVVDVFSERPFYGNPVAAVMCNKELSSSEMQQIAAWLNLSETTFISAFDMSKGQYKVRIFSPNGEMPFAGHPTLGTAVAVRKHFNFTKDKIKQDCPAGIIDIRFDQTNDTVHLIAPDPKLEAISQDDIKQLTIALGLVNQIETVAIIDAGPIWVTVLLQSSEIIKNLKPNMDLVKELSDRLKATGVVVGAIEPDGKTYKVRTFAPSVGVPEDPVCGSGNVAFAYLRLQNRLAPENYLARQGQEVGRDGEIQITYINTTKIELGGRANITASGNICSVGDML